MICHIDDAELYALIDACNSRNTKITGGICLALVHLGLVRRRSRSGEDVSRDTNLWKLGDKVERRRDGCDLCGGPVQPPHTTTCQACDELCLEAAKAFSPDGEVALPMTREEALKAAKVILEDNWPPTVRVDEQRGNDHVFL